MHIGCRLRHIPSRLNRICNSGQNCYGQADRSNYVILEYCLWRCHMYYLTFSKTNSMQRFPAHGHKQKFHTVNFSHVTYQGRYFHCSLSRILRGFQSMLLRHDLQVDCYIFFHVSSCHHRNCSCMLSMLPNIPTGRQLKCK